jgi:hypothetical protein
MLGMAPMKNVVSLCFLTVSLIFALGFTSISSSSLNARSHVTFSVEGISSGTVVLDWSDYVVDMPGESIESWNVYISSKPFSSLDEQDDDIQLVKTVSADQHKTIIYPLEPGKTVYFGVTAILGSGETQKIDCVEYVPETPYQKNAFKDMVGINFYYGGGMSRVERNNGICWEEIAVEMLGTLGIKEIRWWRSDADIVNKYYNYGMGLITPGRNVESANKLGIFSFYGATNEPDYDYDVPVATYVQRQTRDFSKVKAANPANVISAPSTNFDKKSLVWLEAFYQLGGKDIYDVLDLHTYSKAGRDFIVPDGYPLGAPEAMFYKMDKVNEMRQKYGETKKPIISTEFGYSDSNVRNLSGNNMTPLRKSQYLVRGLILHDVYDFRRVYLYSFWDEGTDINNREHLFGLVDYDLQKKPAFFAVKNLISTLGDYSLDSKMQGASLPTLGYIYKVKNKSDYISVVWDGSEDEDRNPVDKIGVFEVHSNSIEVISLFGEKKIMLTKNDIIELPIDGSPVYIKASTPLKLLSIKQPSELSKSR